MKWRIAGFIVLILVIVALLAANTEFDGGGEVVDSPPKVEVAPTQEFLVSGHIRTFGAGGGWTFNYVMLDGRGGHIDLIVVEVTDDGVRFKYLDDYFMPGDRVVVNNYNLGVIEMAEVVAISTEDGTVDIYIYDMYLEVPQYTHG